MRFMEKRNPMKSLKILLILGMLSFPGLLPAPDLPPDGNPFIMLESMRKEIVNQDQKQYYTHYRSFKKELAKFESRNNWMEYNRFGFIGKYQFGKSALEATGFDHVTFKDFKANPSVFPEKDQEKAMDILLKLNESSLNDLFDRYVGYTLGDSIRITRTGILAAAHLAGSANVRQYLESFGTKDLRDRMGTRISDYLSRFSR